MMLGRGALRVLGASDPDPYPDAVTVEAFAPLEDSGGDCVSVGGRVGKKLTKRQAALQAAVKKCKSVDA